MASSRVSSSSDADVPSKKRKRKVVSIEKKLEICRKHKMGQSYTSLSKEYGLRKSTVHDIVQNEDRLTEYALEIQHASGPKRSIIRRSKYDKLDKVLHLWFLQKRAMGTPVSGPILTAKAKFYTRSCMAAAAAIVLSQIQVILQVKGRALKPVPDGQ